MAIVRIYPGVMDTLPDDFEGIEVVGETSRGQFRPPEIRVEIKSVAVGCEWAARLQEVLDGGGSMPLEKDDPMLARYRLALERVLAALPELERERGL